jgi:hypothetical protein
MSIRELLATDEYVGLDDDAIVALASEKRHSVNRDAFYTYRSLASATNGIGPDATRRLIQSLDAVSASDPLVSEMRHCLRGEVGLNINDAATQGMLASFAASGMLAITAEDVAAIVSLTESHESDVERFGIQSLTVERLKRMRMDGELK